MIGPALAFEVRASLKRPFASLPNALSESNVDCAGMVPLIVGRKIVRDGL